MYRGFSFYADEISENVRGANDEFSEKQAAIGQWTDAGTNVSPANSTGLIQMADRKQKLARSIVP